MWKTLRYRKIRMTHRKRPPVLAKSKSSNSSDSSQSDYYDNLPPSYSDDEGDDVTMHDGPSHLFTEWYIFVAVPLFIVVATGAFIHCSTVAAPHSVDNSHPAKVVTSDPLQVKISTMSMFEEYTLDYQKAQMLRKSNMKKYSYGYKRTGVDKRSSLTLQEFYDVYDAKWPVVITDVVNTWPASNWTREFLNNTYGSDRITMKAVDGPLSSASSLALPLKLFYQNTRVASPSTWTYLEDELFIPLRPELYQDIHTSIYTANDLFKLFPSDVRPWDAMLLWGTQYSRSSLHIDPYNWTGTNAVITGRKRWRLFPPGQDNLLQVAKGVKSGFPLNCFKYNSQLDMFSEDTRDLLADSTYLEFDQLPGELLIIPTGWLHQAYNVKETIAISGQFMNHNSYRVVMEELFKAESVQRTLLPHYVDSMGPPDQVSAAMNTLTESQIQNGRKVTENIIKHVNAEEV